MSPGMETELVEFKKTTGEISQSIANAIKPQIIPTIIMELCDDKNIIKVNVEGDEKPYSAYGKYYMRSADEDREISPQQLRRLMLSISDSIFMSVKRYFPIRYKVKHNKKQTAYHGAEHDNLIAAHGNHTGSNTIAPKE